jgi:hypothetical protein
MIKKIHLLGLSIIMLASASDMVAQAKDSTQNEEFEFSVNYKPILAESKRMEETPVIVKDKTQKPNFSYKVVPIQFQTNKIVHTLPPVNHKFKIKDSINGNYAKFGMGNINGILGEMYLGNRKDGKYGYGVYYNHYSSKKNKTPQSIGENNAVLFGNVFTKKIKYGASFKYLRTKNSYYGFNPGSVLNKEESNLNNFSNSYAINTYLAGTKPNKHGYRIANNLDFHFFDSETGMKESYYALKTDITKKFVKNIHGALGIGVNYTNNDNGIDTSDILTRRLNFRIRPSIEYSMGKSTFRAAINTVVSNANKTNYKLLIFPQLYFDYSIIKDELNVFASLTGDVKEYTYKEMFEINPFIKESSFLQNEITAWKASGGLRGKIGPKSNFGLEIGIKKMNNYLMFVSNKDSLNRFTPRSNTGNITFIKSNVDYSVLKKLRLGLGVSFSDYNFDALGLPTLVLNLYGQYKLGNKVMAKLNATTMGNREQYNFNTDKKVNLNSYTDLSAGLEYFYKRFSIFVQANNLLGESYERYYNYDSYGINFLGGLTARF